MLAAGVLAPAAGTLGRPASAAAPSPGGGIGFRLLEAPVAERANSRAWYYIIDHLAPGADIHRRVEVSNTTGSPQQLSLYAAAAEIRDHKFQFAPGRTPNELSTWTTTSRHEVTLAPHARSTVTAKIDVPADAAPGERYAVIWAETAKAAPPGGGVAVINRVGIRIYLSVGPGNPPASAFTIDSLTAQRSPDGRQVVLARVHNTGGRALDLSGDLKLSNGPGQLTAGPFKVKTGTTLAPGEWGSVTVVLTEQVPDGPWRARMRLESGLTRHAAEATIRFPAAPGTAQASKTETDPSYYLIAALAGVILFALVAITFLLNQRKRRARPERNNA
ncbi:peptidase [Sphaerisporangium album]|uniref:Peptidase n=1 Tax=Sphaerisporangium album TaxID=509200 RepID=A0A367F1X5_9ACTN|nr:peptidase [Sphaerisporangium album]